MGASGECGGVGVEGLACVNEFVFVVVDYDLKALALSPVPRQRNLNPTPYTYKPISPCLLWPWLRATTPLGKAI